MSEPDLAKALCGLAGWERVGEQIQRTFTFPDFLASMRFVNQVALAAEAQQHHPDILVRWNRVTLTLSTHDAGGITDRDFRMARHADALALQPDGSEID